MKKLNQAIIFTILFFSAFILFSNCKKTDKGNTTTVTTAPIPPTDLTATVVSTTQVNLAWVDKSTNEVGFKLERKTSSTNFAVIASLGADITSYSDNGLTPNTAYTYRVYSYNSVGASPTYSNEVTITTIGLPVLTTTAVSDFTGIDGISGGNITNDGGSPVTARGVVWSITQNPTITLSTKTTDGTGTGTFQSKITGLSATTKYYVRAYATNAAGTSYGNEVNFTTNTIDLKNGLVAYYPFTGNAGDSSGNSNHGTVNGATLTTDRFGITNRAYQFSNNTISVPHNTSLGFAQDKSFTVSIWVFRTGTQGTQHFIGKRPSGAQQFNWQVYFNMGSKEGLGFSGNTNSTSYGAFSGKDCSMNTWVNIIGIYNSGVWQLYENGLLIATKNLTLFFNDVNTPMTIGNSGNFEPFYGKIDDVRIYSRALTQDEITKISKQ
jgi:hypothetical protein